MPLQVGASTIAFPRAAAAAAWTYLLGGGLVIGAYAIDGGPFGNDIDGVRLFIVAFLLVLLALAVAWICIGTTVLALRAPGMTLRRVPLFAWSSLVGATVWLLILPVLAGLVLVGYIDLRYGGPNGFISGGGAITLYSRISWAFSQPAVYAFGIPVLGFAGAVVPVFSRTRHQQHRVALFLIGVLRRARRRRLGRPRVQRRPHAVALRGAVGGRVVRDPPARCSGSLGLWALTAAPADRRSWPARSSSRWRRC